MRKNGVLNENSSYYHWVNRPAGCHHSGFGRRAYADARSQGGEKNEFTDAFAELLARSYLKTIQQKYGKERVVFLDEKIMTERKAVVRTKVLHNGREVPVEVKMALVENEWRIYDAVVEGVSLIANYRAQFAEILLNKTPAYLIERIKNKLATGAVDAPNLPE